MWQIALGVLGFAAVLAAFIIYRKSLKTLDALDTMLDEAIAGKFSENRFTEEKLSKIESKMYRYLTKGQTSLKEINTEKDRIKTLIADISHQTKTPVSNILLYTQLLKESKSLDEDTKKLVSQVEIQTEKLHFLIASLVKVSRLENGIVALNPKQNRVQDLISQLDFSKIAEEKGINLCIQNDREYFAYFDFKWTLEALSNIVDNALKYTPSGGEVSVFAKEYEMFICIEVADTGIGISEADSAQIFARFYRAQEVSEESGVGIGLYLAREILSKEGGYIKVQSSPGKGSVFSVFLPKQANLLKL